MMGDSADNIPGIPGVGKKTAQKFIKDVKNGDKRILFLDGKVIGAVNRVSQTSDIRSKFHAGGIAQKTTLTKREEEICQKIGPK